MTDMDIKECTAKIKAMADVRQLAIDNVDTIIRSFHDNLGSANDPIPIDVSMEEKKQLARKEMKFHQDVQELRGGMQGL